MKREKEGKRKKRFQIKGTVFNTPLLLVYYSLCYRKGRLSFIQNQFFIGQTHGVVSVECDLKWHGTQGLTFWTISLSPPFSFFSFFLSLSSLLTDYQCGYGLSVKFQYQHLSLSLSLVEKHIIYLVGGSGVLIQDLSFSPFWLRSSLDTWERDHAYAHLQFLRL